jgi:hypothetical protein
MITKHLPAGFKAIVVYAMSCAILLTAGFTKAAAQADIPLDGIFSNGIWSVSLDNGSGTGAFTKVGNTSRKVGEPFLKAASRSNYNTWRGQVYDNSFKTMQKGTVSIIGNKLTITPGKGAAYVLTRVLPDNIISSRPDASSSDERLQSPRRSKATSSGSGCAVVQCHGITKAGRRCLRTTSNCSGYCWQHDR